jgi:hypothetical protein
MSKSNNINYINTNYLEHVDNNFLDNKRKGLDLDSILLIQFPYITNKQIEILRKQK